MSGRSNFAFSDDMESGSDKEGVRRKRIHEKPIKAEVPSTKEDYSVYTTGQKGLVSKVIPEQERQSISTSRISMDSYPVKASKMEDLSAEFADKVNINVKSGTFTPAPPDTGANPTVYINKQDGTESLLHKLSKKDTLQGLAIKYGVELSEIKKVNKLWSNDAMFARKELIIPTTMERYTSLQSEVAENGSKQAQQPSGELQRSEMIKKFVEQVNCEEDVARHYLEVKKYNLSKAVAFYESEQKSRVSKKVDGSVVALVPLDDLEIWTDEEARRRQMRSFDEINVSAMRSSSNSPVVAVSRNVRNRLNKNADNMFNL